ncbi:MAG: RraA family protein [Blastocatellia bacterium]
MKLWNTDEELFALARRELFTAVVGDCMDKLNLRRQFLPQPIKPLRDDMVTIGRAMPVIEADVFGEVYANSANPLMARPFGLMLRALDDLKTNELYVCAGGSLNYAMWGELMSVRAGRCGAAGAIMDGFHRDTPGILAQNFPVFSRGSYAQDQGPRGKVIDFRVPVEIGQARIEPGDIVFGDGDGVCVIPQKAINEVFHQAIEKARGEKHVRQALESGMPATEAFETFGIL